MLMNLLGRCALAWLLGLALAGGAGAAGQSVDEVLSHDGLKKVSVKGLELVYIRPGATLAGYNKIKLDPVEVAFQKDWDPQRAGSRLKVSSSERDKIRAGVAALMTEEFTKELQRGGAYAVVTEAGPDVLRFQAGVANLYVNAPDTQSAGRSRTLTQSAGEMTLVAEMFDSETGQVLARVVDRKQATNSGQWNLTDSWYNEVEARTIAANWARILRNGLDKARALPKAKP